VILRKGIGMALHPDLPGMGKKRPVSGNFGFEKD